MDLTASVTFEVAGEFTPKPLPELGPVAPDDPALAKYREQIDKDLAKLE